MLFLYALLIVWVGSPGALPVHLRSGQPRTGGGGGQQPADRGGLAEFLASMVTTFTGFAPLGIVLVAMLGSGSPSSPASSTPASETPEGHPGALPDPMLILVAIVSHTAADAGYVLVIPIGGIIFHAAGRHPLAGIAAAFAGFPAASPRTSSLGGDALLQGFTQSAAQLLSTPATWSTPCATSSSPVPPPC